MLNCLVRHLYNINKDMEISVRKENVTKPSVTTTSKELITYLLVREQSEGIRDCVHYLSVGITTLTTAWDKICEESSSNIKIYPSHVTTKQISAHTLRLLETQQLCHFSKQGTCWYRNITGKVTGFCDVRRGGYCLKCQP